MKEQGKRSRRLFTGRPVLSLNRHWHFGKLHCVEGTFDKKGNPLFKGEWRYGVPVGEHIRWSQTGAKTRTRHVHGIPEDLADDVKKRDKIIKKIAKAKDSYSKQDVLSNKLEHGQVQAVGEVI